MVTAAMKLKDTYSLEKSYDQHRQHIFSISDNYVCEWVYVCLAFLLMDFKYKSV